MTQEKEEEKRGSYPQLADLIQFVVVVKTLKEVEHRFMSLRLVVVYVPLQLDLLLSSVYNPEHLSLV